MNGINRMTLLGRLGRDPEARRTAGNVAVVTASVATTRSWKDKTSGEAMEDTEWHRVVAYDRLAEVITEHLRKGSLVYFEGRLQTRKWQDKDGADRYSTEIIADKMQMLDKRAADEAGSQAPAEEEESPI